MEEFIKSIAGIAVFCSVLDVFTERQTDGYGFKTVCGLAIMLSVISSFRMMICC